MEVVDALQGKPQRRIMLDETVRPQPVPFFPTVRCRMDPSQTSKTEVLKLLLPGVEAWVCLLVILGMICCLILWVRAHWRDDTDGDASAHKMLTQFRESQREGVLTDEEYRLIKSRLVPGGPTPGTVPERQDSNDGPPSSGGESPGGELKAEFAKGVAASPSVVPAGSAQVQSNIRVEDTSRLPS